MRELGRRGRGERESGAFLLGRVDGDDRTITDVAYYDDLAPGSLNGVICFPPEGYTALWALCRERGLKVLGDIHTHGGPDVRQSKTDRTNPMIAQRGHVALIAPRLAEGHVRRHEVGLHAYLGDHQWRSTNDSKSKTSIRWRLLK